MCLLGCLLACGGADTVGAGGGQGGKKGGKNADAGANSGGSGSDFGNTDAAMENIGGGLLDGGSIDGKAPDQEGCGNFSIETTTEMKTVPGNILVVYDKSGSMNEPWNLPDGTASTKLIAAGKAFIDALIPNASLVNVGTVFFPSSGNCDVALLNSGAQIDMMNGVDYLNAWTTYWMTNAAGGRTPLLEGLQAADATITGNTFEGTVVVLVITDGDPNCGWDEPTATGLVAKWLGAGVKTYVIGLPGTTGGGQAILNNLAVAGGTTMFFNTTDSMALQTQLQMITSQTISTTFDSCRIKLDPPPPDADKVQMVAIENGMKLSVPRMLSADAGWTISADGTQVDLTGLLCRDAKAGRFSKITFEYGCVMLPPIKPPIPE